MRFGSMLVVALSVAALFWSAIAPPKAAAQATPAPSATACLPPTNDEVERLARAWVDDSLAAGDPSALDRLLAPDVVHHAPDLAVTFDAEGVKTLHQGLIDAFPDAVYTTDLVVAETPWAFAHYQAAATHNGELQGIAPTGKRVVRTGTNAFRVDVGRILESWSSLDELGRPRQLGALPAEADALPGYRLTYGPIAVDGDDAAAYWTASGTDTGGMMGAEPTGKALTWDGITIVRLECGKIADIWSEADILGLQRQLGLLP